MPNLNELLPSIISPARRIGRWPLRWVQQAGDPQHASSSEAEDFANRQAADDAIKRLEQRVPVEEHIWFTHLLGDELARRIDRDEPYEDQALAFKQAVSRLPGDITMDQLWLSSEQIRLVGPFTRES